MSDGHATHSTEHPGHATHTKDNFTVTFHPAFASRCVITHEDGESEVYKQSTPHPLNGEKHPPKHTIRLKGGKYDRDIALDVHDPKHHIKQIKLELYGHRSPEHVGSTTHYPSMETFTADNQAETCPPTCVTGGP